MARRCFSYSALPGSIVKVFAESGWSSLPLIGEKPVRPYRFHKIRSAIKIFQHLFGDACVQKLE